MKEQLKWKQYGAAMIPDRPPHYDNSDIDRKTAFTSMGGGIFHVGQRTLIVVINRNGGGVLKMMRSIWKSLHQSSVIELIKV